MSSEFNPKKNPTEIKFGQVYLLDISYASICCEKCGEKFKRKYIVSETKCPKCDTRLDIKDQLPYYAKQRPYMVVSSDSYIKNRKGLPTALDELVSVAPITGKSYWDGIIGTVEIPANDFLEQDSYMILHFLTSLRMQSIQENSYLGIIDKSYREKISNQLVKIVGNMF